MTDYAQALLDAALAPYLPRRRPPKPREPVAAERRYQTALRGYNRRLVAKVSAILTPVLAETTDGPRLDAELPVPLLVLLRRLASALEPDSDTITALARGAVATANAANLAEVRRVLGIPVAAQSPRTQAIFAQSLDENIQLIESINSRMLEDLTELLTEASNTGMRAATLSKRIVERYSVSRSRADLIAQDQILKMNGSLTQARHQDAGVTEYIWSTSQDERVRPEHRALNGRRFSWDNPPDVGHPGQDIRCRCVARPVI